jgi:hypothetical protein
VCYVGRRLHQPDPRGCARRNAAHHDDLDGRQSGLFPIRRAAQLRLFRDAVRSITKKRGSARSKAGAIRR